MGTGIGDSKGYPRSHSEQSRSIEHRTNRRNLSEIASYIDNLGTEHLAAVLAHEQAHYRYRDTWCFFWLGWVRQITIWLPQTEAMWQELLVLRELRADRWASKQTDPLLVAEALLLNPVYLGNHSFLE